MHDTGLAGATRACSPALSQHPAPSSHTRLDNDRSIHERAGTEDVGERGGRRTTGRRVGAGRRREADDAAWRRDASGRSTSRPLGSVRLRRRSRAPRARLGAPVPPPRTIRRPLPPHLRGRRWCAPRGALGRRRVRSVARPARRDRAGPLQPERAAQAPPGGKQGFQRCSALPLLVHAFGLRQLDQQRPSSFHRSRAQRARRRSSGAAARQGRSDRGGAQRAAARNGLGPPASSDTSRARPLLRTDRDSSHRRGEIAPETPRWLSPG